MFEGPSGKVALIDLFEGRSQLIVYHFMWLHDSDEGCPSCSFAVDDMPDPIHLNVAPIEYNYKDKATLVREGLEYVATHGADGQGVSVFVQDGGKVLHTYSAYSVLMSC